MTEVLEPLAIKTEQSTLWTERDRFSVRRLPVYEGEEGKADVFNNGRKDGVKCAVPFHLRLGSQLSEQGGPQLGFAPDPTNPTRIIIPDDIRRAGEEGFLDASRIVILEQRGEGSEGELWVREGVGNAPLEIRAGDEIKRSLRFSDLTEKTLVIPLKGCKYALSVTGFNPAKREVIVQKVLLPDEISGPDKITAPQITSVYEPSRIPSRFSPKGSSAYDTMSKWFPIVVGGSPRGLPSAAVSNGPAVTAEVPAYPAGRFPEYTDVLTVSKQAPEKESILTAAEAGEATIEPLRREELLLDRVQRLSSTRWSQRALQGALLVLLLSIPRDTIPLGRQQASPIKQPSPERSIDNLPKPVLETGLQGQSSWGVFLHHLGRIDASAIESVIHVPDEVRGAWDAVREIEAQTGHNIDYGDPLLLEAVQSAIDLFGLDRVQQLYENNVLRGVLRVNLGLGVSPFGKLNPKVDDRFGIEISEGEFALDTLGIPRIEDTIKQIYG